MGRKAKGVVNDEGRTCIKCGEFKVWSDFSKDKSRTRGKNNKCKLCDKQHNKKYREENRDARLEYHKRWYEENRDVTLEKQKQYNISPANYETYKDQLTPLEYPRESKDGYLEVKCATCREYFIPTNEQVRNRIQVLNGNLAGEYRLYCSDSCKESCSVFRQIKYPRGFKKPSNREYQPEFRTMILERDNYTCQVCNKQFDKKHLQAHHITPVACSPMEQVDIDNGICVCKECHIDLHLKQEGITYAELIKAGRGKEDKEDKEENVG